LRSHGVTILLTTHYLEEAELLADRVGIIRLGKLVIEGTIEELRDKIQGIRGISVRISRAVDVDLLQKKLESFSAVTSIKAGFDGLRSTVNFAQRRDQPLPQFMDEVLTWLKEEKIPFSKFATSEPNLEEVFLAIASGEHEVGFASDQVDSEVE